MREDKLLSPGGIHGGFLLRREAAKAISSIEILASRTPGGKTAAAKELSAAFTDWASKLAGFIESVLPTVTTRIRTATNTVVVTCSEALQPRANVPLTAFTFAPARTVTAIVVTGSTITITATGAVAGDTLTYVKPTDAKLTIKDLAGNELAAFATQAVA